MAKRQLLPLLAAAALIVPASATAGGWATVGMDPPPAGLAPGEAWDVELTILQHGITPLEGVRPRVIVTGDDSRESFAAAPTEEPGVYRASVSFPGPGVWRYSVDDGFSATHSYPPLEIGGGEASSAGPDLPLALALATLAGLAAALGTAAWRHRRDGQAPAGE